MNQSSSSHGVRTASNKLISFSDQTTAIDTRILPTDEEIITAGCERLIEMYLFHE